MNNFNKKYIKCYFDYVYHFEPKDEETVKLFVEALNILTERELAVVCYRHGLIGGEPKGLEEVAKHFELSPNTIKTIDIEVIEKLYHPVISKFFFDKKDNEENSADDKKYKFSVIYKDYLPEGIIMQDLVEQAEKKEKKKK